MLQFVFYQAQPSWAGVLSVETGRQVCGEEDREESSLQCLRVWPPGRRSPHTTSTGNTRHWSELQVLPCNSPAASFTGCAAAAAARDPPWYCDLQSSFMNINVLWMTWCSMGTSSLVSVWRQVCVCRGWGWGGLWAVGLVSDVNISGHTGSYPSGLGWAGGLPLTSVTAAPTARALTSLKYAKIRPEIRPGLHVKFARWFWINNGGFQSS